MNMEKKIESKTIKNNNKRKHQSLEKCQNKNVFLE